MMSGHRIPAASRLESKQTGKQADWRTSRLESAKSNITCTHERALKLHCVMRLKAACIGIQCGGGQCKHQHLTHPWHSNTLA